MKSGIIYIFIISIFASCNTYYRTPIYRVDYFEEKEESVMYSNSQFSAIAVVGNSDIFTNRITPVGNIDPFENIYFSDTSLYKRLNEIGNLPLIIYNDTVLKTYLTCDFLFSSPDVQLTDPAKRVLDSLHTIVCDKNIKLRIIGHTDNTGKSKLNETLSKKRADAVSTYMIGKGYPEDKITKEWYGKKYPITTNSTIEGRRINRRVEIYIIKEKI